jgi:hypothetical protein
MTRVFISYSDQDRAFAQWVKGALAQAGIVSNLDDAELPSTESFTSALRESMHRADALLAILPNESAGDNFVMLEIGMAQGLGKRIVAVAAPGAKPDLALLGSLTDGYVLDAATLKQPELAAKILKILGTKQADDRRIMS